jgi:hypothetical protein
MKRSNAALAVITAVMGCSAVFCLNAMAAPAEETLRGLAPAGGEIAVPASGAPAAAGVSRLGGIYIKAPDILTDAQYAEIQKTPAESYFGEDKANFTPSVRARVANILSRNAASGEYRGVYSRMYQRWMRGMPVRVASGRRDFKECDGSTLAYTYTGGESPIYLCRLEIRGYSEIYTAQSLIHEVAHVVGYDSECDATRLERTALEKLGMVPYTNGYVEKCGL